MVKLKYQPTQHLLAFVDALGFHQEIKKAESDKIEKYLTVVDSLEKSWKGDSELKLSAFGDSVILGVDVDRTMVDGRVIQGCAEVFHQSVYNLCSAVAELQYRLALEDIWTRGAIVMDRLLFHPGKDRLLGPAFHKAYKLETNIAKFPRVIVDGAVIRASGISSTVDFIESIHSAQVQKNATPVLYNYYATQSPIEFARDVPAFIDFVGWGVYQLGTKPLKKLSDHIMERLKDDVDHYSKYRWLADYLITVSACGSCRDDSIDGPDPYSIIDNLKRG